MTQLTPDELEEIERKVARFREAITNAAIRRAEKKNDPSSLKRAEKQQIKKQLELPETKIALLQRLIAGEKIKNLAADYNCSVSSLSSYIRNIMLDQFEYIDDDDDNEWLKVLHASKKEQREIWRPIALERLMAARPR